MKNKFKMFWTIIRINKCKFVMHVFKLFREKFCLVIVSSIKHYIASWKKVKVLVFKIKVRTQGRVVSLVPFSKKK